MTAAASSDRSVPVTGGGGSRDLDAELTELALVDRCRRAGQRVAAEAVFGKAITSRIESAPDASAQIRSTP